MTTLGVIGGSGLYQMSDIHKGEWIAVDTPFGAPSDDYFVGEIEGVRVVFLPRHGRGHRILPSELNFRANIYGMKKLGVEQLIAVSAVGSLKKEIAPGDIVIPDQFIDRTRGRISTFFGRGIVAHVSFADPVCGVLTRLLAEVGQGPERPFTKAASMSVWKGHNFLPVRNRIYIVVGELISSA